MVLSELCTVDSSTCVNFWRDLLRDSVLFSPLSAPFLVVMQRPPGIYQLVVASGAVKDIGQHVQCHFQAEERSTALLLFTGYSSSTICSASTQTPRTILGPGKLPVYLLASLFRRRGRESPGRTGRHLQASGASIIVRSWRREIAGARLDPAWGGSRAFSGICSQ